ncbi:hypothetical protein WJX81_007118 [Elliptochloris bilobata]|uniref:tRNA/rRNA methyltransferase SpoU type domain-containing protein n=1 Tax=Elliptochloris bilobata TaxID=381761 RepID=A0AAW1R1Y5_9CHLO
MLAFKGALCAGGIKYAAIRKSPDALSATPSRFPFEDRFEHRGKDLVPANITSEELIEFLQPLVTPARAQRIRQVTSARTFLTIPVMEGLWDRGNLGALCRLCDGLGIGALHSINTQHTRFKRARGRTSLGAEKWLDTPLHAGTWAAVDVLRAGGYRIVAAQPPGPRAVPASEVDWSQPIAVFFGNEREGLSGEAAALADFHVTVPMAASFTDSFNVAQAAAILSEDEQRVLIALMMLRSVY